MIKIKKTIGILGAVLLINGCATNTAPAPVAHPMPEMKSHTFAGVTLRAIPEVSSLVNHIESLQHNNTMGLNLNSNQNVRIRKALNISVRPNESGYLKIVVINPEGKKSLLMPNFKHGGYLRSNRYFSTTNRSFSLRADHPRGLHYIVVAFSQRNSRLQADANLMLDLEDISNEMYGRHYISVFPMRVY